MSTDIDVTKMFVDDDIARNYAEYRPRYSDEIIQVMVDYCKETMPNLNLCVDVGCGSGQSTVGFAKYFKKVIGVDISPSQIAYAPKNLSNVQFEVSSAEKLPFVETKSVDLWCSGESFNYMPQKLTLEEADRVLKPGGTMAIFGYPYPRSEEKPVDDVLKAMRLKLFPYLPREAKTMLEKFSNVELPYPDWFRYDKLKQTQSLTLRGFIGFLGSLWSVVTYSKANPQEDFIGDTEKSMKAALDQVYGTKEDVVFEIIWDVFIIIGRKPLKESS